MGMALLRFPFDVFFLGAAIPYVINQNNDSSALVLCLSSKSLNEGLRL